MNAIVSKVVVGLRLATILVSLIAVAGCSTFGLRNPVPAAAAETAELIPSPVIRFWGDELPKPDSDLFKGLRNSADPKYLALSGGGMNGAYGAGFLVGWTARGDRPKFDIVTGISVGALIAPMAFLGPRYDQRMQQVVANLAVEPTKGPGVLAALLGAPAIADNTNIRRAIANIVDKQALDEIAAEHRAGRRLLIGTTNLDAERPVVWDIGAIANSNIANRLELVHTIMLASAAVPGIFPPILIRVNVNGRAYDELHVDGGVTQQVVLLPDGATPGKARGTLYVIYNGTIEPQRDAIQNVSSVTVLERAVPSLLKYRGRGDIIVLENAVRARGIKYMLTAISADFPQPDNLFMASPTWLNDLFTFGYKNGRAGIWQKRP